MADPVLLSWSGGKDSALTLSRLRAAGTPVAGLLTTVSSEYGRVSIHGFRRSLLQEQARALGLPLHEIELGASPTNAEYEAAWQRALKSLPESMVGASTIAFGDIFLEDVRAYRERQVESLGLRPLFPLWGERTDALAREVIDGGFEAIVVCVDTDMLPAAFAGRRYDSRFLAELPAATDPCGERGEFHTFVAGGPGFAHGIDYGIGATVLREDRFAFCDLLPTAPLQPRHAADS